MKETADTQKFQKAHKIRIRWMNRPTEHVDAQVNERVNQRVNQRVKEIQTVQTALGQELQRTRRLNLLRDAQLGNQISELLSERSQLARERRELAAERQSLQQERREAFMARVQSWVQTLRALTVDRVSLNVRKPALPRIHRLSKLTPIGQGILIWGFSGMAIIGIGFLIARLRRRAAELRALDEMQDGAQLSVAKPLHATGSKKSSVKLWS